VCPVLSEYGSIREGTLADRVLGQTGILRDRAITMRGLSSIVGSFLAISVSGQTPPLRLQQ
jgi:hypothetical protein